MIFDKLNCTRPQTRANLGNCGHRQQRNGTTKEGKLTNINEKSRKTHRRNAGTYRQRALTHIHKLKKCFGYIKKNVYLCSRKIRKTITKTRRPTGYQGHRNHDNIHHPAAHQRRNRRSNTMGNSLGNARRRAGTKRHSEATNEKQRKKRSDKLGIQNHSIDALLKKHKAGATPPAKRRNRNNNPKTTEK